MESLNITYIFDNNSFVCLYICHLRSYYNSSRIRLTSVYSRALRVYNCEEIKYFFGHLLIIEWYQTVRRSTMVLWKSKKYQSTYRIIPDVYWSHCLQISMTLYLWTLSTWTQRNKKYNSRFESQLFYLIYCYFVYIHHICVNNPRKCECVSSCSS